MRIAQIAPAWESVPPQGYGGTERVVHFLTEELVRLGHEVTLFASGDSQTSARLIAVCPKSLRAAGIRDGIPWVYSTLELAYSMCEEFDILHSHLEYLGFPHAERCAVPSIHTMHGRLDICGYDQLYRHYPRQPLVSISESQRRPVKNQNWIQTIHHGLPQELFSFRAEPEDYLLFLGRISPEKGPLIAIEIAERTGMRLVIAAKVDPFDHSYFEDEVEPRIRSSKRVEFIGEVGDEAKNDLIGRARALVMPIDWPEPFGLTAIESIACGTPVIARPCGALPEILTHGRNGFLSLDIDGLVKGVERLDQIDRRECRKTFEERFTVERMARNYLEAYQRAMDYVADSRHPILREEQLEQGEWLTLDSALAASIPKHVLKDNQAFLVVDPFGNITEELGGEFGFYKRGTRYISKLDMNVNGRSPVLLGSDTDPDEMKIVVDVGNDQLELEDGIVLRNSIHVRRELTIVDDALHQRVIMSNFGDREVPLELELDIGADFRDLFEVRGIQRKDRGWLHGFTSEDGGGVFRYTGLDKVERTTTVSTNPTPDEVRGGKLIWRIRLPLKATAEVRTRIAGQEVGSTLPPFEAPERGVERRDKQKRWLAECPTVETSDDRLTDAIHQALVDLGQLMSWGIDGLFPTAGVPWYGTIFGRDAIITALQLLPWRSDVAVSTLLMLAHFQARERDDFTDAEPGKILHEWREGEMANLREIPFIPYFGTVDATPLFIHLAHEVFLKTGNRELLDELWPKLLKAAEWLEKESDLTGDGLVQYKARCPIGLRNQGWKDSWDSVFHKDGSLGEPPIALVEVQAYAFLAWRNLATLARVRGEEELAREFDARAETVRERVDRDFWMNDEGTYGIALDHQLRLCRAVNSNAGHCLYAGLASPERATSVAARLLAADMASGFGIRTIARNESRYNPMSYHNGSIWPHDNALIAEGFRRYRLFDAMSEVHEQVLSAVYTFPLKRVPELYCGFDRSAAREPVPYPTACAPQAWASGTLVMFLNQMMGLRIDASSNALIFSRIRLPRSIEWIRVRGFRYRDAELDFVVKSGKVSGWVEVEKREGEVEVFNEK